MKRHIYYLASLFVLLVSMLSFIPTAVVHADAKSKAEWLSDICGDGKTSPNPNGSGGGDTRTAAEITKEYNACKKGFDAALKDGAVKPAKNATDPCYKTIYKVVNTESGACELGYVGAYPHRDDINKAPDTTPKDPNAASNPDALAACSVAGAVPGGDNHDTLVNDCTDGYIGAAADKTKDASCGSKSGINQTACETGFDLQTTAAAAAGSDDGGSSPTCEHSGFNLSWIFCPMINGLASAVDGIYSNLVQPLLLTKPIELTKPADDPTHTYEIWSNFRIYGDVFLVIALLVVVFGQSIGGGAIDAYTAKKVLPRLVIAAILINISIYLVAIAVDLSNVVGNGVSNLIEAPFKSAGAFKLHISGGTGDLGMVALVGGGIWAVAALGPLLEFLLLFFLIPAFLTFLAILVTVLVRQGLIIFLILVSPVAFALYCLPNTEQYFRKWWELLLQTLLVYPIIAALFAMANVLSVTIDSTTSGITKNLADLVSIIALFVPLFLIPYSFRIAGGVLGRLHEVATNYGKRGSEALKGNANNPDSWRNRSRSKLAQRNAELGVDGAGMKTRLLKPPDPRDGRAAWSNYRGRIQSRRQATRTNLGQAFFENDSVAKANKGNDQFYLAVANRKMAEEMRDASTSPADVSSWQNAINAADLVPKTPGIRMQAAIQHAATGFQYASGQEGYNQVAETMSGITGAQLEYEKDANGNVIRDANGRGNVIGATGNRARAYADAMDNAQFSLKGAGRFDQGGINRGAGYEPKQGLDKASLYELANGKKESITALADLPPATGSLGMKHAIAYKELEAMRPNAKGAVLGEIDKQMGLLESRGVKSVMQGQAQQQEQVMYIDQQRTPHQSPNRPNGWTPAEIAAGARTEQRVVTNEEVASKAARTYERPDPNTL